jgi:nitrate/nitrite transporter NarK
MMFLAPYWCLPPMLFRGTAMAAAIALVNAIQSLGGFLGPNIIGIAQTYTGGKTGAFLVLAAFAMLSGMTLLSLRRQVIFRKPMLNTPIAVPT